MSSIAFCFLMLVIFFQFGAHIPCMKSCDELFAECGPWVQGWWLRKRGFYDRHSLGLYAFCFYSFAIHEARQVRAFLLWLKMCEASKGK